ncbi:MAG: hypothetical protein AMXMBFR33_22090 [Candidatus Xenobia bacterium]
MLAGLLILLIFLVLAGMMMTKRIPALLALPLMALLIGLVSGLAAGLPWTGATADDPSFRKLMFDSILRDGTKRLSEAMMFAIFGAVLSQVVMRQGIAQRIVRVAAEYAGDRKLLLAFFMTAAMAGAFCSLTGLGAVVMVGSLALPILTGSGLSANFASCLMLFAVSLGGMFNASNWGVFKDVLKLSEDQIRPVAIGMGVLMALMVIVFLLVQGFRERRNFAWAALEAPPPQNVPLLSLLTPILPVLLILVVQWPVLPAFLVGILYGCLTTEPLRLIPNLTAAFLEGLKDVAPVLGLFIGIGMTVTALSDDSARAIMGPLIKAVAPGRPATYVLFFALLAPLALYRGPFNTYGLGAGFIALLFDNGQGTLPALAIMAAFMAVGQIQGTCDPTNTANVWIASFTHTTTEKLLKMTIPFVWAFVLLALIYAVLGAGVMTR